MLTTRQMCVLFPGMMQHPGAQDPGSCCPTQEPSTSKRCLFGTPDPEHTRLLLEEQFLLDRERFLARWGFDILTGTPVVTEVTKQEDEDERPKRRKEEVEPVCRPSPYSRQTRLTDFWRNRKQGHLKAKVRSSSPGRPAAQVQSDK